MASTEAPVTIGFLFSQTGVTSVIERPQGLAARLAVEEINQAGGILGREVRIAGKDTRSVPAGFRAEAERLLREENAKALFGCYMSSTRKAVHPVVDAHESLLFYPTHYEGFEYAAGCIYSGAAPNQNARLLADYMTATYGEKFFFVGSNYVFPYEYNRIMRDLLSNRNATVVDEVYISLDPGHEEIARVIQRIRENGPSIVFSTLVGVGALRFYEAYHRAGFDRSRFPISSVSTGEPEMMAIGLEASVGNVKAAPYFSVLDNPINRSFVAAMHKMFGHETPISAETEAAYFQVKLYAEAVNRCGAFDRESIMRTLPTFSYEAPQGTVRVDTVTHHTSLWPRVAVMRESGVFEVVRESPVPVDPAPYLMVLEDPVEDKELLARTGRV